MRVVVSIASLTLFIVGIAEADENDDAALALGHEITTSAPMHSAFVALEAGISRFQPVQQEVYDEERLSADVRYDKNFLSTWRFVVADRLDMRWRDDLANEQHVNTLKEAFLSWQPQTAQALDVGRINARYGVALSYRPTDYFRASAVRSVISLDPGSLRDNRLGTLMIRGQTLWTSGSLTALYSPRLSMEPSAAPFNLDLGATNNKHRWLLALTQAVSDDLSPQLLFSETEHDEPQFGLNATSLVNHAIVTYLEVSAGHSRSLLEQAADSRGQLHYYTRSAAGFTYTTAYRLSFSLEYQYNGAGLDRGAWNALRHGDSVIYGRYRQFVVAQQDIPTRQNAFVYAAWHDAFIKQLDLSAFVRYDLVDRSRLTWLESRYHLPRIDVAFQWDAGAGSYNSNFGGQQSHRRWQLSFSYYP